MKIVVGLGNPGIEYEMTRHNIGFWVLDHLAERHRIPLEKEDALCISAWGRFCKQKVLLVKPLTYMNVSGRAVSRAFNVFCEGKAVVEDLVVIHDDLDLPLGRLKVKQGGSDGGHRGLESITANVGADYIRVRLGIGRPEGRKRASDYVLKPFEDKEMALAQEITVTASQAIDEIFIKGLESVQRQFNRKEPKIQPT